MVLAKLQVAKAIDEIHLAQCLNYLKTTGLPLCPLLNFGKPRLKSNASSRLYRASLHFIMT
jgi:GxxExxY protein